MKYFLLTLLLITITSTISGQSNTEKCNEVIINSYDTAAEINTKATAILNLPDSCILQKLQEPYGINDFMPYILIQNGNFEAVSRITTIGVQSEIDPFFFYYGKVNLDAAIFLENNARKGLYTEKQSQFIHTMILVNGYEEALLLDFDPDNPYNLRLIQKVRTELPLLRTKLPTVQDFEQFDQQQIIQIDGNDYLQIEGIQQIVKVRLRKDY